MEKKELDSMKKHRGLFLALGLAAMIGLMAGEARAGTLTLSVYAGSGTGGTLIDSFTGGSTSLSLTAAQLGVLNTDLAAAGFSAYSFTNLSGTSNNPGVSSLAFVQVSGQLAAATTGTGMGADITVVLNEDSFNSPSAAAGNELVNAGNANYKGNTAGETNSNTTNTGMFFQPLAPSNEVDTPSVALPSTGGAADNPNGNSSIGLGPYATPFSLASQTVLRLTATPGAGGATNGFANTVSLTAIPEPASIVMMLTGMPLPLVVLGILRRRRAAA
jgi:hypothetical protein